MEQIKHKSVVQMLISIIPVAVLMILDHLTKYWAYSYLRVNGPVSIIRGVFSLTYTQNTGAAWGMMGGSSILNWLPIIVGVVIAVFYQRVPFTKRMAPLNIVMIMLFSGAIANRIDRSVYGGVQDFLYFELIDFPIFNVADCYIVIASIVAVILFIFYYKDDNELSEVFSFKKNKADIQ